METLAEREKRLGKPIIVDGEKIKKRYLSGEKRASFNKKYAQWVKDGRPLSNQKEKS